MQNIFNFRSKKLSTTLNKNSKIPLPVNTKLSDSNEIIAGIYRYVFLNFRKIYNFTFQHDLFVLFSDDFKSSANSNSSKHLSETFMKTRGQNVVTEICNKLPSPDELIVDDSYTPGLRRRRQLQDKYVTDPSQLNLRFQRPQIRRSRDSYYKSR